MPSCDAWGRTDVAQLVLRTFVDDFARAVRSALFDLTKPLGEEVVLSVEGSDSEWPVDTGYSKANFGWTKVDDYAVRMTNEAEYARYHVKAGKRTIQGQAGYIARRVDKEVQKRL